MLEALSSHHLYGGRLRNQQGNKHLCHEADRQIFALALMIYVDGIKTIEMQKNAQHQKAVLRVDLVAHSTCALKD